VVGSEKEYFVHDDDLSEFPDIPLDYGICKPTIVNEDAGYVGTVQYLSDLYLLFGLESPLIFGGALCF
jgi:hypothetical protein